MKKLILIALVSFGSAAAFGQKIGIHVDGVVGKLKASGDGITISSQSRFGWKAGLMADLGLGAGLHLMPQLNVVSKGGKFSEDGDAIAFKPTYVEVPVLLTYNVSRFYFGAGPSFAFGVGGKVTATMDGESESAPIKFDGKEDATDDNVHFRSTDIGVQFIGGVNLPMGFTANIHYNVGLSNIVPGSSEEGKLRNSYFGFGIGKYFGK